MITDNYIEQNTQEWLDAKLGKPSASNCSKIITPQGKPSKQREGYLYELASERVTKTRPESYINPAMEEGHRREEEACSLFKLLNDVDLQKIGICYPDENKQYLCSPDNLIIGRDEGLEVKNPLPKTQAKYLYKDNLLSDYFCQVQFSMFVTGYDLWHLFSYVPCMRHVHIKVERDKKFITALQTEMTSFLEELDQITEKIK